jgi:hypothetical protein
MSFRLVCCPAKALDRSPRNRPPSAVARPHRTARHAAGLAPCPTADFIGSAILETCKAAH